MTYAVIFRNPDRISGPYDSEDMIRDLPCFPQPGELVNPAGWVLLEPLDRYRVTKSICEHPAEITGQIAKRQTQ